MSILDSGEIYSTLRGGLGPATDHTTSALQKCLSRSAALLGAFGALFGLILVAGGAYLVALCWARAMFLAAG